MTREGQILEYQERAQEADDWAAAVRDIALKSQWPQIATNYRALAKSLQAGVGDLE